MRKISKLHWFALAVFLSIGAVGFYVIFNGWAEERSHQQLAATQSYDPRAAGSRYDKINIDEQVLTKLFKVLDEVPSPDSFSKFNPRPLIHAVNLLQPLGKEKALAVVHKYLQIAPYQHEKGRQGIILVLRVLFDVSAETDRMPQVGRFNDPPSWKSLPRFPIALVDAIPLLLSLWPAFPINHSANDFKKHDPPLDPDIGHKHIVFINEIYQTIELWLKQMGNDPLRPSWSECP